MSCPVFCSSLLNKSLKTTFFQVTQMVEATQHSVAWFLRSARCQQGDIYFKMSSRAQETLMSSSLLRTSQKYLMLTTQHNSISPCLSTGQPVTSIVNQGRAPLVQDKIREAWRSPEKDVNPLLTRHN